MITKTMNTMLRVGQLSALCLAAAVSLPALANEQDVWSTTVPASSCEPSNEASANKVVLSNGAWVFSGNNIGLVTFYCPLAINAFTVANFSNDNDISSFRIYYRDTDGGIFGAPNGVPTNQARVTARLTYRKSDGMYSAGSLWSSQGTPFNVRSNTTVVKPNVHDVQANALYSFIVTMLRTTPTQNPAFSGIDFPFPVGQ